MRRLFRNFDFVAPVYPLLERASFGDALNQARRAFLARAARADRILLIGEGNGRFLADLLREKTGGHITVVDSSPKMLSLLQRRTRYVQRRTDLRVVCADFLTWDGGESSSFDAIVTHFFLDLFRPDSQRRVVSRITDLAKPRALWSNVDYRLGKSDWQHRWVDWLQYRFDALFSGVEADRHYDPSSHLKEFGWLLDEERTFCADNVTAQALSRNGIHPDSFSERSDGTFLRG